MKKITHVAALAVAGFALAASAFAANSLSVVGNASTAGGLNGTSKALRVGFDGVSTNNVYVEDQSPNNESHYKFSFFICPGNLNVEPNKSIRIAAVQGDLGQHIILFLRRDVPGGGLDQWLLNTWVANSDADPSSFSFGTSTFVVMNAAGAENCNPASAAHRRFEVEFTAGTGANGSLVVRRTSNAGVVQVTKQVTGRNSDGLDVDAIRIGALANSGINAGTANSGYFFDEFESYR